MQKTGQSRPHYVGRLHFSILTLADPKADWHHPRAPQAYTILRRCITDDTTLRYSVILRGGLYSETNHSDFLYISRV